MFWLAPVTSATRPLSAPLMTSPRIDNAPVVATNICVRHTQNQDGERAGTFFIAASGSTCPVHARADRRRSRRDAARRPDGAADDRACRRGRRCQADVALPALQ